MISFIDNKNLVEARKNNNHFFLGKQKLLLPKWEDVIKCFDDNVVGNNHVNVLDSFGFVLYDCKSLPYVNEVLKSFSKLDPEINNSAHVYISMSSKAKTFGWHKDTSDVLFWQIIGETQFMVKEEKVFSYNLNPNDMLYIPKGVMHNTVPNSPRVGISMGLDY